MMIHFFPYPFLIGLGILTTYLYLSSKKWPDKSHLFFRALFGGYLLVLAAIIVFPFPYRMTTGPILTPQNVVFILEHINLRPFASAGHLRGGNLHDPLNILLMLPFGFLINFVRKLKARKILWLAPAVGFSTEISQLLVSLLLVGGVYRSVDINDVIFNAAGVALGYGLFRLAAWIYLTKTKWHNFRQSGLLGFIHEVASKA